VIHDVEPVRLRSGVPFRHLPLHVSIANSTERHRGHALLRSFRVKGLKKGFHGLLRVSFGGQLFDGADDAGLPFSIALLSRFVVPNSQVSGPFCVARISGPTHSGSSLFPVSFPYGEYWGIKFDDRVVACG